MRISDWSSDVCSSDLRGGAVDHARRVARVVHEVEDQVGELLQDHAAVGVALFVEGQVGQLLERRRQAGERLEGGAGAGELLAVEGDRAVLVEHGDEALVEATLLDRSEEHTSELQSLMRNSYAVFCL